MPEPSSSTFMFADIAGFTALTEAHGDEQAAQLAADFAATVGDELGRRDGDWFGSTVNVAARIAGLAGGGEVLLSEVARELAGDVPGVAFHECGRYQLRNVPERVAVFCATREAHRQRGLVLDPVCRMAVAPAFAIGDLTFGGVEHTFCSLECAAKFAGHPEVYAGRSGAGPGVTP